MAQQTYSNADIEIKADFAQASSPIMFRCIGDDEWQPTVYQVADAAHKPETALRLVGEWSEQQS